MTIFCIIKLVICMEYLKIFTGLRGEIAFLAFLCLVIVIVILILTIIKKLKDK